MANFESVISNVGRKFHLKDRGAIHDLKERLRCFIQFNFSSQSRALLKRNDWQVEKTGGNPNMVTLTVSTTRIAIRQIANSAMTREAIAEFNRALENGTTRAEIENALRRKDGMSELFRRVSFAVENVIGKGICGIQLGREDQEIKCRRANGLRKTRENAISSVRLKKEDIAPEDDENGVKHRWLHGARSGDVFTFDDDILFQHPETGYPLTVRDRRSDFSSLVGAEIARVPKDDPEYFQHLRCLKIDPKKQNHKGLVAIFVKTSCGARLSKVDERVLVERD